MKSKGVAVEKKLAKAEVQRLVMEAKMLAHEANMVRRELSKVLKELLGADDHRRMQIATIHWLVEVWGDDPEDFAMMYQEHLDEEGVVIPELEVVHQHFPELKIDYSKTIYLTDKVVRIATGK